MCVIGFLITGKATKFIIIIHEKCKRTELKRLSTTFSEVNCIPVASDAKSETEKVWIYLEDEHFPRFPGRQFALCSRQTNN